MTNMTVSTQMVRDVAGQVSTAAGEIATQLSTLRSQIDGLQGDWQGPAASSLQDLFAQWDKEANDLNTTLEEISTQMKNTAQSYDDHEASLSRGFGA